MEFALEQTDMDEFTLTIDTGDPFRMSTVEAVELFAAVDHCIGDYAATVRSAFRGGQSPRSGGESVAT